MSHILTILDRMEAMKELVMDNTEVAVRPERPVQRAESWQQGVGPTSFVHNQAARSVASAV